MDFEAPYRLLNVGKADLAMYCSNLSVTPVHRLLLSGRNGAEIELEGWEVAELLSTRARRIVSLRE
jgi:hypothetical protein